MFLLIRIESKCCLRMVYLSLLLSEMMFWILLILLLAYFDDFHNSNNWAVFLVEFYSLSFESSPTALYNLTITLFLIWFSKRNVERGWEEKNLVYLQDHAVIWLVLGQNKGQRLARKEFIFIDSFWWEPFCTLRWCAHKRENG